MSLIRKLLEGQEPTTMERLKSMIPKAIKVDQEEITLTYQCLAYKCSAFSSLHSVVELVTREPLLASSRKPSSSCIKKWILDIFSKASGIPSTQSAATPRQQFSLRQLSLTNTRLTIQMSCRFRWKLISRSKKNSQIPSQWIT